MNQAPASRVHLAGVPMLPVRLLLATFLLGPAAAWADPAIIRAEGQAQTMDCTGDAVRVEGNRNVLTFYGACRSLDVRGDGNRITIELRAGARVHVEGQQNRIGFSLVRGTEAPQISVAGVDSIVSPAGTTPPPPVSPPATPPVASAAPAAPPQQAPASAAPRPAPTPAPAAPAPAAPALAAPAVVASTGVAPAVVTTAPLSPPTGPLTIQGNDQQREASCAGVAAVIEGDRGSYVLRGGCKSLTVRGQVALVQAELAPRAPVLIEGAGTTLFWAPTGNGAPPVFTVKGEGSHAVKVTRIP